MYSIHYNVGICLNIALLYFYSPKAEEGKLMMKISLLLFLQVIKIYLVPFSIIW